MDLTRSGPELLCPAGSMERLQTALAYGADAVYLGGAGLNLRAKAGGFSLEELKKARALTRNKGARLYYCLNALPLEKDLSRAQAELDLAVQTDPDALIIADPGLLLLAGKKMPSTPVHLSTQANTCNSLSVNFWKSSGITRVNLARELNLKDIRQIRNNALDTELELFVHGAMCMAVSGRCFLSAHLNKRSANQGLCAHPCRYEYQEYQVDLEEKTRPGRPVWTLKQSEGYSKIFSAEDLCLVKYIPWFFKTGIDSLKIEGRTKSVSYLAVVTDVYRTALNDYISGTFRPDKYIQELSLAGTRPMGSGFFLPEKCFFEPRVKNTGKKILARIIKKISRSGWQVQVKEKWSAEKDIELMLPGLKRSKIRAGSYHLTRDPDESRTQLVNSGQSACFYCDHPEISENLFMRSSN